MTGLDEARWRKSSRSQTDSSCVELHPAGAVRDSKNPAGPALTLPDWAAVAALVDLAR